MSLNWVPVLKRILEKKLLEFKLALCSHFFQQQGSKAFLKPSAQLQKQLA
jgi:hypothetical protein